MKAVFTCIFLLVCTMPTFLNAQWAIGVAGAPSIQTIQISDAVILEGFQPILRPEGFLWSEFRVHPNFSLMAGFSLGTKGAKQSYTDSIAGPSQRVLTAHYASTFLGCRIHQPLAGKWALSLWVGLGWGHLLGAQLVDAQGEVDYKNFFAQDIGVAEIGPGLELDLGKGLHAQCFPLAELQFNRAYASSLYTPSFFGIAPRLGLSYVWGE